LGRATGRLSVTDRGRAVPPVKLPDLWLRPLVRWFYAVWWRGFRRL